MRIPRRTFGASFFLAATLACTTNRTAESLPRVDRNVVTQAQMLEQHFENVYAALEALRSNWLVARGPDSFTSPSIVKVYIDNVYLGPVETLRSVSVQTISSVQHLDPVAATARYGVGHGAGVIYLETMANSPRGKEPIDLSARLTTNPRFDWFEYEGTEEAYHVIKPGGDYYLNPILAGFYPDPSMVRAGDDYYLVTSSFAYFPGIPIFHSKDLVSWTQIGHVLDRRSQLNLDSAGISRGLFAPSIRYRAGIFYMIVTLVDRGGNFYVTATNPAGPWSDPTWLPSVDGIDPSFFFDDNGKAYVVNNGPPVETPRYEGHRAIWIQELDVAAKKMIGPRTVIVNGGVDIAKKPIWIEAPHIFKRNGFYYLICAEGGTGYEHSEVVFRSSAPTGPWIPFEGNPILTQRHLDRSRQFPITTTGHADFVETPNGEWWAAFLGVRPYGDDLYNTGRETFLLPVEWRNDWPIILEGSAQVPYAHRRPTLPKQPAPAVPTSGEFTVRDEFDGTTLPMYWVTIRAPGNASYDLTSSPGGLTLYPRDAGFEPSATPAFVGRRQQHRTFSASTSMTYVPSREGEKSGIVAFQNDRFYYFLALARANGKTVVRLEKHAGPGAGTIVASAPVEVDGTSPLYLEIRGKGATYDFLYATKPGEWTLLHGDADGTILSTKVASGFVGAMIGLYAFRPSH
ncbi:MAG: glycoside hydrolase family 43 protein [bacterium]